MGIRTTRFIFTRLMGWKWNEPLPTEKRVLFLAAPHTSIWDFVIGYMYFKSFGASPKVMIKKEAFFPPVGWLLRALGGVPIDRRNPTATIRSLVSEMNSCEGNFYLVMCPEGTRKAVKKWKTGYHLIAKETGCAVYLGYYDYKTRTCGCGEKFELGTDAREDTNRIQALYADKNLHALHPEGYIDSF